MRAADTQATTCPSCPLGSHWLDQALGDGGCSGDRYPPHAGAHPAFPVSEGKSSKPRQAGIPQVKDGAISPPEPCFPCPKIIESTLGKLDPKMQAPLPGGLKILQEVHDENTYKFSGQSLAKVTSPKEREVLLLLYEEDQEPG